MNTYSPYIDFTCTQWHAFRQGTPLTLSEEELSGLRGQNETVCLREVEEVYLPLSRLLNLYVAATQELYHVTSGFLGHPAPKVPYVIGVTGSVGVGKSMTSRILKALLARWPNHPHESHLTHENDRWVAHYYVNAGPTLQITVIDLKITGDGENNPAFIRLAHQLPIHVGQKFSSIKYQLAKHKLSELAAQQGYLSAIIRQSQVRIDLEREQVKIIIHMDTGSRFYFGEVNFSKTTFSDEFLQRFLSFNRGDTYSLLKLRELQQTLSSSNFFDHIEIVPEVEKAIKNKEQTVPITVNLVPSKGKQYIFGAGYGTDTGARGILGIKLRHLTPTGHHLQTLFKTSRIESSVAANYVIPGSNPITDKYTLSLTVDKQHHKPGHSQSVKFIESYTTMLKNWKQTLAFNALYDRSSPRNEPKRFNFLLYPTVDWLRIVSDNQLKPKNGSRIGLTLLGASRSVLSSINFFQVYAHIKLIRTLGHNNRFILRGKLGYTEVQDLSKLPLSLRFYAGGAQSIRGYGYKSIGSGRQLITGSVEYQRRLFRNWYGTVFYDAGNVSSRFTEPLKQGAGVGVMWLTPIGAVELTVAKALSRRDQPLLLQFSMGPEL